MVLCGDVTFLFAPLELSNK